MNLRELRERRAQLVGEMRSITNKPAGSNGDLSADQVTSCDKLNAELRATEQHVERLELLAEVERSMEGEQLTGTGDNRLDDQLREFSLRKAIASQVPDLARTIDCGRELEISKEIARRAGRPFAGMAVPMAVFQLEKRTLVGGGSSPDFGGRNLIPTDHQGFIDVLRARLIVRRLGATVLSGLQGS